MHKSLINKSISKARILSGIFFDRVFQGPYQAYINLTDHCNLNCLMCSVYSPLVKNKAQNQTKGFLRKEILDKLSASLERLKVQLVTLTGGGEPFLHPFLLDFVKELSYAKKDVTIVTNGTLIEDAQVPQLLEWNVNLRFSLIAASPETYVDVHPNQTPATFEKLTKTLTLIRTLRKNSKSRSIISILFVIFKNNFHEIPRMIEIGKEYQVDFVHFKPAIFDHQQMKELFLDDVQLRKLQDIIGSVKSSHDISSTDLSTMCGDLEQNQQRIVSRSGPNQRRSIPCFKGWTFCWILATGEVVPCCDCNVSLGNINDEPFENIWYSARYSEIRRSMTTLHQGFISLKGCRCDSCRPDSEEVTISKGLRLIRTGSGRKMF
jgi:MoaA/NifB/PqqE/SkfB family radical SAM enzyme